MKRNRLKSVNPNAPLNCYRHVHFRESRIQPTVRRSNGNVKCLTSMIFDILNWKSDFPPSAIHRSYHKQDLN